jgi:hypothetical protein
MSDLTTLAHVKQWVGLANTVSDDLLERMITSCSAAMESWMNRTIARTSYVETRNGTGGSALLVQQYPIVSVSGVTVGAVAVPARARIGDGGYVFDETRILLDGSTFTRGMQNVTVSYVAGYATVPQDIEQACIDIIGDWFRYKDRAGKLSEGIEGQTISFTDTAFPSRAQGVLNQYRKVAPIL